MADISDFEMKQTLKDFYTTIASIANEQNDFMMTKSSIVKQTADSTPYYSIIINEKKDAKDLKKSLKKLC